MLQHPFTKQQIHSPESCVASDSRDPLMSAVCNQTFIKLLTKLYNTKLTITYM